MVAPALAALGMALFGGGAGAVGAGMQRKRESLQAERTAALYRQALGQAQEGGVDPLSSPQATARFGLNLLANPDTAEMGQSLLTAAMTQTTAFRGQDVTTRGQDITAQGQRMTQDTAASRLAFDEKKEVGDQLRAGAAAQQALATLTNQQAQQEQARAQQREAGIKGLRNDLDPHLTPLVQAGAMLRAGASAPEGYAGDQQIIYGVARLLDPLGPLNDATVRSVQGDPSAGGTVTRLLGKYLDGETLQPGERKELLGMAANLYRGQRTGFEGLAKPILATANRLGYPTAEIFDQSALLDEPTLQGLLSGAGPAQGTPDMEWEEINAALAKKGLPPAIPGESPEGYEKRTGAKL